MAKSFKYTACCYLYLICLLLAGCAQKPVLTMPLIEEQEFIGFEKPFKIIVVDDRDFQFKHEKIIVKTGFPVAKANILADQLYDIPLDAVFEKMLIKRFGNNKNGLKTEFRLKVFYTSFKLNDLVGVPFLGILAVGADVEWHGVLKVDVGILDKENKYVLNKVYEESFTEMRPSNEKIGEGSLIILEKLFSKFSDDFTEDVNRTRLPAL